MPEDRTTRKDLYLLFLSSVLLTTAAFVFAGTGDAPIVFLLTVIGLAGSFLLRRPLPRTSRSFVYAGMTVTLATVLGNQLFPIEPGRFFLIPAEIYGPGIIYLGVAATYFDQRETNVTAIIALALLGLMLAGNAVPPLAKNQHFPIQLDSGSTFLTFYAAAVFLDAIVLLLLVRRAAPRLVRIEPTRRYRWLRAVVFSATLCTTVAAVGGLRTAAKVYERTLQEFFVQWMQRYMQRRAGRVLFPGEVDLWRTPALRRQADSTIVLRARSEAPPGYLRGRAYYLYRTGHWTGSANATDLTGESPGARLTFTVYRRGPGDAATTESRPGPVRLEVFPAGGFRSDVLLAPGGSREFELIATQLRQGWNGTLTPRNWESGSGYVVRGPTAEFAQAYEGPLPRRDGRFPEANMLKSIPSDLKRPLEEVVKKVFGPVPERLKTQRKLERLHEFFAANFSYSLGEKMVKGKDPVLQFLARRRGHCELFAATAALLLRSAGTPARYVTGFVCAEPHPGNRYWVSRLKDAHAWAEAWIPEEKRWALAECTPASGIPNGASDFSTVGAWIDRLLLSWQETMVRLKRGYVAETIVGVLAGLFTALRWLVWHSVRGPLVLGGAVWIWRRRRHRRQLRLAAEWAGVAAVRREAHSRLARLERRLRRFGLERQTGTTLREWNRRVAAVPDLPAVDEIGGFLKKYEECRSARPPPPPAVLAELDAQLRSILRALRTVRPSRFRRESRRAIS